MQPRWLQNLFSGGGESVGGGGGEIVNPLDIIAPGGNLIGTPGSSADIRNMPGGIQAAEQLLGKLTQGAVPYSPANPYAGSLYQLPGGGGFVGLRPQSKSGGPAIDLNIPGLSIKELHFPP
jgi:hypothetical protein